MMTHKIYGLQTTAASLWVTDNIAHGTVKTTSEMTNTVSGWALNSTPSNPIAHNMKLWIGVEK